MTTLNTAFASLTNRSEINLSIIHSMNDLFDALTAIETNRCVNDSKALKRELNAISSMRLIASSQAETMDAMKLDYKALIRIADNRKGINKKSFARVFKAVQAIALNDWTKLDKNTQTLLAFQFNKNIDTTISNKESYGIQSAFARCEDNTHLNREALHQDISTVTAKSGNNKYMLEVLGLAKVNAKTIKFIRNAPNYYKLMSVYKAYKQADNK